jgi:ribosomal protein L11 methyltransferase
VDIEQIAVETTRENAAVNHLADGVLKAYHGNILTDAALCDTVMEADRYDYIAANIVADVIIAMLPLFKKSLKDGGTMILSGIISPRKDTVLEALKEAGFAVQVAREKNDWAVIRCTK